MPYIQTPRGEDTPSTIAEERRTTAADIQTQTLETKQQLTGEDTPKETDEVPTATGEERQTPTGNDTPIITREERPEAIREERTRQTYDGQRSTDMAVTPATREEIQPTVEEKQAQIRENKPITIATEDIPLETEVEGQTTKNRQPQTGDKLKATKENGPTSAGGNRQTSARKYMHSPSLVEIPIVTVKERPTVTGDGRQTKAGADRQTYVGGELPLISGENQPNATREHERHQKLSGEDRPTTPKDETRPDTGNHLLITTGDYRLTATAENRQPTTRDQRIISTEEYVPRTTGENEATQIEENKPLTIKEQNGHTKIEETNRHSTTEKDRPLATRECRRSLAEEGIPPTAVEYNLSTKKEKYRPQTSGKQHVLQPTEGVDTATIAGEDIPNARREDNKPPVTGENRPQEIGECIPPKTSENKLLTKGKARLIEHGQGKSPTMVKGRPQTTRIKKQHRQQATGEDTRQQIEDCVQPVTGENKSSTTGEGRHQAIGDKLQQPLRYRYINEQSAIRNECKLENMPSSTEEGNQSSSREYKKSTQENDKPQETNIDILPVTRKYKQTERRYIHGQSKLREDGKQSTKGEWQTTGEEQQLPNEDAQPTTGDTNQPSDKRHIGQATYEEQPVAVDIGMSYVYIWLFC